MLNGMEKSRGYKINLIVHLVFLAVNLIVLLLINLEYISYGPDLQDPFMSFITVVSLVLGMTFFFLVKIKETGIGMINFLVYAGFLLEVLYLLFEN